MGQGKKFERSPEEELKSYIRSVNESKAKKWDRILSFKHCLNKKNQQELLDTINSLSEEIKKKKGISVPPHELEIKLAVAQSEAKRRENSNDNLSISSQ